MPAADSPGPARFPLDALNRQLDALADHPFYRGRIPGRVADAGEFAAAVPLTDRASLLEEMRKPGHGAFGANARAVRVNFTPAGDAMMPILHSANDLAAMTAAARSHLDACGIGPGDVCAVTFGYHMFVAGLFYQTQMEAHGVACAPIGPGDAARAAELCRVAGATVLAGNPSFARKLVEAGLEPPKAFFAGGEPFTGNPALYEAVRAAMPGTLLVDSFSLSEFLPVARTFPGGEGVHVFDELVHAEVIDPATGAPVGDGERGELVLTHLVKEAQPLLRYRTGDLTVRRATEPLFGRTVNLPRVVFGRTDDMVKVKGVKLYPSEIRSVLLGIEGLTGAYRLGVSARASGDDRLVITLEGSGGDGTAEEVARRFRSQTLIGADDVVLVPELGKGAAVEDTRRRPPAPRRGPKRRTDTDTWRLVADRNSYADFSVSVSPAVEKAVVRGEVPPTVFLSVFDRDSITIGVNEDPEQVLDLGFCRSRGVDFRRRVNGGGTIYAGEGSAFLVYFVPTSHPGVPETTAEAFPRILTALADTFRELYGIPAAYRPLNDIEVEGRKLVPTSLKIEDGVMTFRLVINVREIDTETAARAMPMPPEKVSDKAFKDLGSRFTCLEREIGRPLTDDDLVTLARTAATRAFAGHALEAGALTDGEHRYAGEFRNRFDTDEWLYGKSARNRFANLLRSGDTVGHGRTKALGGMIWTTLAVRDGRVLHAVVNGDWHPRPIDSVGRLESALADAPADRASLERTVREFLDGGDVEFAGIEAADLVAALDRALADRKPR